MTTLISILSPVDKKVFESPPVFSDEERIVFFEPERWALALLETLRGPTNKVGFVLQLGYFRAANKFFVTKQFHLHDIEFVAQILGLPATELHLESYTGTTFERHRAIILDHLGFRPFDSNARQLLQRECMALSEKQMWPRSLFMSLVDFLRSKKIEVPSYHALAQIITDALKAGERELHTQIKSRMTDEQQRLLDGLLEQDDSQDEQRKDSQLKRYKITLLKKSYQSVSPSKIKKNVEDLKCFQELFDELDSVIRALDLPSEVIQFYARITLKSQVIQLLRRDERKYLYLLAFVIHRYYRINDLLADTILQAFQTSLHVVSRQHKEKTFQTSKAKDLAIKSLTHGMSSQIAQLKEIKRIVLLPVQTMTDAEKVETIKGLLDEKETPQQLEQQLQSLESEANRGLKGDDYNELLEARSLKLQNRISPILKSLQFDTESSDETLIEAIHHFKIKDGNIGSDAPLDFLDDEQRKALSSPYGKWRPSLYKVFLFQHVADAIKSGALNLKHSYKYRPFEDYLISKKQWKIEKEKLLERAGLTGVEDFSLLEPKLRKALADQFQTTNQNIQSGENKYAKLDAKGNLVVSTPKKEKPIGELLTSLFPKDRVIPLFEVLSTINRQTKFTEAIKHHQAKHIRKKPNPNVFIAGITGIGCNHGIRRIAQISRNISQNELEHTVNWHFTSENLVHANDKVLELIERLQLPKLYKLENGKTHTSSDGQKYNIHVESLNANFSYKYFGKGRGVTVYVFLDDTHRLFYSTVISSSESEAAYVIDGLMHNDVVQSDIHSTDTAGYSEIIFGVCHLLGISFAPRIKNFRKEKLYSFESPSVWREIGYQILPSERINVRLIAKYWDDILRFITTIKLRQTSASQLFRRLNSYSRQHPLYKAIKEFGKIFKTLYLLKYTDILDLRQSVGKQLNKQESSNKFGKAVFHGNNQEFRQPTKEEQKIAEGCKRLIENSIICWNYLYLSQIVHDAGGEQEKKRILEIIKEGSVVTWHHINMQGEYDFSNESLQRAVEFGMDDILNLKVF